MTVRKGLAVIERALLQLPERCRYHGDEIDRGGNWTRRACCDTGFPALLRREALRDLAELNARPSLDRMTAQQCPKGLHADWAVDSPDVHGCPWCALDQAAAERLQLERATCPRCNTGDRDPCGRHLRTRTSQQT